MQKQRAQGTIEYLIIVAIIVVVALVLVSLLTDFFGTSPSVSKTASETFWKTQLVAITDSAADSSGNLIISFRNISETDLTLNSVEIDGVSKTIESGSGKALPLSQSYSTTFTGVSPCSGDFGSYRIRINYTSSASLQKGVGPKELIVSCAPTIAATSSSSNFVFSGDLVNNSVPLWSVSETAWISSATDVTGIAILPSSNTVCFGGNACDANIAFDGSDLVFSS